MPVEKRHRLLKCIAQKYGAATRQEIRKFAKQLGASEGAVKKWIYCDRRPRYDMMLRIERLTGGDMSLQDW